MAITQRHRVTFTVTSKLPTDAQTEIEEGILELAKALGKNPSEYKGRRITGHQKHLVRLLLTGGMEAVASFIVQSAFREAIKEMREDYSDGDLFAFSPAMVTKVAG